MMKPEPSTGWRVNVAGARGRLVPLSGEICRDVGLDERRPTPPAIRRAVTPQVSAEAVVVRDRAPRRAEREAENRTSVLA